MAKRKNYPISNAQNSIVRSILNNISEKMGTLDGSTMENILKYFNHKCAYTGKKLKENEVVFDHLIPCNRKYGGLYLAGNLVPTSKEINAKKSGKDFIEFINDERNDNLFPKEKKQEVIDRLKEYQKDFEYPKDIVTKDFTNRLAEIYSEVEGIINTYVLEFLYTETPKAEKELNLSKNVLESFEKNLIINEKLKVKRRVPKWLKNTYQQNSIILLAFLKLYEKSNEISVEQLEEEVTKNKGFHNNFQSNFKPMTEIYDNNHGKVFEEYYKGEKRMVKLWSNTEKIVLAAYKEYKQQ
ncbi:HNH endonuclease [Capnocytophaga leadbetteri]|jgi:hypothetical protein|uniref:HNH endonuclease n=1 Tax=Capnocytophaga leadbetteri TaxID=327575 RepID=UPI0028D73AA4|nr:HNH endonuclease signature motif containing protein [Capnocytophaga leadbetteri]